MTFNELFKAELAQRGIVGRKADLIVENYQRNKTIAIPLGADWEESKHPREKDGRFTEVMKGIEKRVNKSVGDFMYNLPNTPIGRRISDINSRLPKWLRGGDPYAAKENKPKSRKWGQTITEVIQEQIADAFQANDMEKVKELQGKLKLAEQLSGSKRRKSAKTNQDRIKRYYEVDDEIDHLEEMYGDRERGTGLKWPQTQEADEDRKRYKKLLRERTKLDKQIDWKNADDDAKRDDAEIDSIKEQIDEIAETDSDYAKAYPDFDEQGDETLDEYLRRGGRVNLPK